MSIIAEWLISASGSFVGSFFVWFLIFHYDVEDHWRLWKVRRGRLMDERDAIEMARHEELLQEERDRGNL
jgi:hypothetical protein